MKLIRRGDGVVIREFLLMEELNVSVDIAERFVFLSRHRIHFGVVESKTTLRLPFSFFKKSFSENV